MRRSLSLQPRWLRRTVAFMPLTVMTACPALVFLVHPTLIGWVTVPVSLVAVLVGGWLVRVELRADRHATPSMVARYRALARLLDDGHDREVRVDSEHQVTILLMDDRRDDGTARRAVLRFNQAELDDAGRNGISTPVVFDQFSLDHVRHVVRHRFGAVTITRGADGRTRIADIPEPDQERSDADVARLLDQTAADIPPMADLDDLIKQVRSGVALAP